MEDGYFCPNIEDIRIGYECETRVEPYPNWVKTTIEDGDDLNFVQDGTWEIRVPSLNKEQIIAEGWNLNDNKLLTLDNKQLYSFSKNNFGLLFRPYNNDIRIYDKRREIYVYQGECKCINTFRYLNKLFNIQ